MSRNRETRTGIAVLAFIVASITAQFNSPADTPSVQHVKPTLSPDQIDCLNLADGKYSSGCSRTFVQCVNGMTLVQVCPADLVFDQESGNCEYAAKCGVPSEETASAAPSPSVPSTSSAPYKPSFAKETPTVPPKSDEPAGVVIDCTTLSDGMYSSGCSRTFVQCVNGMTLVQVCPADLVFDQESGNCEYAAKCGVPSEETASAAPSPSVPSTSSAPYKPSFAKETPTVPPKSDEPAGVVIDCTTLSDGTYSSGCTHAFVQCANGNAYPLECQAGLVFDKRVDKCVWPESCSSEPSLPTVSLPTRPSDLPSTVYDMKEEKEQTVTEAPLPNDGSVCTGTGRRAMGKCSSGFVQCIGGKLVARRCPGQSLFDEKIGLCVYDLEECEMDVDEEEVTDQESTVVATGSPQQDASVGYNRQAVHTVPSYTEQTVYQQYPQSTPHETPHQQQYQEQYYPNGYQTQYPTQSQSGYQTGYQAIPAQEYQTGYQPSAQDGLYQSIPESPVYSSFGDSSLPSQPLTPECEIGSFRRVSACSTSFDACSPTARQWIRRLCGKSHRFDSSANKCRPIFEVRECDEPMSSYVPPPVQQEVPAVYPDPVSSLEYGVPLSGRVYEEKHVVDPFKGGFQSGRMGSNPFVAIGNTGTFYTDDGSRWVGSTWSEGGKRRRGEGRRRHHKHGHHSGDYVIVSGNPFGSGRARVMNDEWKGKRGQDGPVRSSLTAGKGKRVRNVVDNFKGRVSHFAPPLGAVNPFAVKRADGHRRRGRKSCRRDKHRRRQDWEDEDCEEKNEEDDEDEEEERKRPIHIGDEEKEKTESVEESAVDDERPVESEAVGKELESDGEENEETETDPELRPESIDNEETEVKEEEEEPVESEEKEETVVDEEKTDGPIDGEETEQTEENEDTDGVNEEENEKTDEGEKELEETEQTEETATVNGPVEDVDDKMEEEDGDEENEDGSIEGDATSEGQNEEERVESETGDAEKDVEELIEDDVEKEFEDGATVSAVDSKTEDVETPDGLENGEKNEVKEEEETGNEKIDEEKESIEESEEMEKDEEEEEEEGEKVEENEEDSTQNGDDGETPVDEEGKAEEENGQIEDVEGVENGVTGQVKEEEETPESIEESMKTEDNGEEKEETPVTVERPEDTVDEKIEEEPELNEPEDEEEETQEEAVDDGETPESIEESVEGENEVGNTSEHTENGQENETAETDPEEMPEAIEKKETEGVNEEEKKEETEETAQDGEDEESEDESSEGDATSDGLNEEEMTETETGDAEKAKDELNEDYVEKEFEDGKMDSAAELKTEDVPTPESLETGEKNEGKVVERHFPNGKQTKKTETPKESAEDDYAMNTDSDDGEEEDGEEEEERDAQDDSTHNGHNEQGTENRRRRRSVAYDPSVSTQSTVIRRLSLPRSSRLHRSRFSRLCVSSTPGQTISIGQCRQDFVYCKSARRPVVAACPVGDLFDAVMSTCVPTEICGAEMAKMETPSVTPSSVPTSSSYEREGERPTMPVPTTTTHVPEKTPVVADLECSSLTDGAYPLSDCSGHYFVCSASVKHLYECPSQLIYHKQSDSCEWPANVPACNGGAAADTTFVPATDTTQSGYTDHSVNRDSLATTVSPMHVHFDCIKDGGFAIDCKGGFVMCSNGYASFMKCSPGLVFEESSQSCQYPAHVDSCGLVPVSSLDVPTTVYTPSTPSTPSTTAMPARAVEVLVTTPVDKDACSRFPSGLEGATRVCPSSFVICAEGQVTAVLNCPEGTFFDERTKQCDYRAVACAGGWTGEAHGVESPVEKDVPTVSPVTESEEYGRRSSRPYRPSMPVAVEKIDKEEEVKRDEVVVEEKPVVVPSSVEPVKGASCDWKGVAASGLCSSQFIICSNGKPEQFGCSIGLVFSPSTSACEYPEFVSGCPQFKEASPPSPSSSPSSSPSPVSTTSSVSDAVVVDESAAQYSRDDSPSTTTMMPFAVKTGDHTSNKFEATGEHCTFLADQPSFPLNYCSMTYAVCTAQGLAYRTNCTFGFLFDSVLRRCVPSEHCGQPYLKDIVGASSTSSSLNSLTGFSTDTRCVGAKDGSLKATALCSGQYIRCEKESVVLQTCAGVGRVFSPLTGRCVQQVQMAECASSPRGLTPPITRPKTVTPYAPSVSSESLPTVVPAPSHRGARIRGGLPVPSPTKFDARSFCTTKHSDGLYRNPENCAGIVQCFGGEAFSYPSCAEGLFFNEVDGQCDFASNVPECASQADPVTIGDSSVSCKGQPHGAHLADDSDCSIYYRCVWGSLERLACPNGTVFNPRLSVCDYPSEVPHCQKQ